MQGFIKAVGSGKRRARALSREEARQAFSALLMTEDEAQVGAFLLAMRMKGETAEELAGFVDAIASKEAPKSRPCSVDLDAHGDGRPGRPSLLPAAVAIAAAAGAELDVRLDRAGPRSYHHLPALFDALGPLPRVRISNLQEDHPALKRLLDMRMRVGVRTFVNSVVKLWSPHPAEARLIGIFHSPYHEPMAGALQLLGAKGWVVQAPGGLPEPPAETRCNWTSSEAPGERLILDGRELGPIEDQGALPKVTGPEEVLALHQQVFAGKSGPARKQALVSAALILFAAKLCEGIVEGYERASRVLESESPRLAGILR